MRWGDEIFQRISHLILNLSGKSLAPKTLPTCCQNCWHETQTHTSRNFEDLQDTSVGFRALGVNKISRGDPSWGIGWAYSWCYCRKIYGSPCEFNEFKDS